MEFEYKNDKIFLLSKEEYEQYYKNIPSIKSWWWLRSPGIDNNAIITIYDDSSINFSGLHVDRAYSAVRPALYIDNMKNYKIGDIIIKYKFPWVIIGNNIAIAEVPIGFEQFDTESVNYNNSYIRNWLQVWKNKRI